MKAFVFYVCVCILTFSLCSLVEIKKQLKSAVGNAIEDDGKTCLTEINISFDETYNEGEIVNNVPAQPGNEEKRRKNGCLLTCILKKQNLMEGTDIKEAKVHAKLNEELIDNPLLGIAHKAARKCIRQVKDITEECEKGFMLLDCIMKVIHKLDHEEHKLSHESIEETTEDEVLQNTK